MLHRTRCCGLRYLTGARAKPGGSVAALLEGYLDQDGAAKHAANVPVSQRYYYVKPSSTNDGRNLEGNLSQRNRLVQLRLGSAQMLASTAQGQILNSNGAHPLFYAQTSPRQAGLCLTLVAGLRRLKIHRLTELQGALIPLMLKGKHVIAHAETGTGKSFGIALAITNRIVRGHINYRLHTVVLVPTEELALQYDKWFRHLGGCTSQIVQAAVDSIPLEAQLARLHNVQPHVLVGTPQRIAEIARLSPTLLGEKLRRKVDCLVLDEADLVLSTELRQGRQTLTGANLVDRLLRSERDEVPAQLVAASATIDGATAQMLNTWTRNDKAVRLTTSFTEHSIPASISFYFFSETRQHPLPKLLELTLRVICRQSAHPRILLLTEPQCVQEVCRLLQDDIQPRVPEAYARDEAGGTAGGAAGPSSASPAAPERRQRRRLFAAALHSAHAPASRRDVQPQQLVPQRGGVYVRDNSSLARMNEGNLLIGVGSFEMGRGLHVQGITHVILYGACPPATDFVHCAGRTGRMGDEGDVIVLFPKAAGRAVQQVCHALELPFAAGRIEALERLLSADSFASASALRDLEIENDNLRAKELAEQWEYVQHDSHP